MTSTEIRASIRTFLAKKISTINEVADDVNLFESGLLNSMFAMLLVQFVEDNWSLTVEDSELSLSNFSSVDAIAKYIEGKQSK